MSLNKDYKSSTDEQIEKMRERLREERRKAQETDLSQFDFQMPLSKTSAQAIWPALGITGVMAIRYAVKNLLYVGIADEALTLKKMRPAILTGLMLLIFIAAAIVLRFTPMPEVKGEFFRYKNEDYHYSDIFRIKVSRIGRVTVYLSNGKKIYITRDFENYETFLVWAEKCGIEIDRAVDCGDDIYFPQDLDSKTAAVIIALIVLVIVVVLHFSLKDI
jgi:hypothetical protein